MTDARELLDKVVGQFLWANVEHASDSDAYFVLDRNDSFDEAHADRLACHLLACYKSFESAFVKPNPRQAKKTQALNLFNDTRPAAPGSRWLFVADGRHTEGNRVRLFVPALTQFLAFLPTLGLNAQQVRQALTELVQELPACFVDYTGLSEPYVCVKYQNACLIPGADDVNQSIGETLLQSERHAASASQSAAYATDAESIYADPRLLRTASPTTVALGQPRDATPSTSATVSPCPTVVSAGCARSASLCTPGVSDSNPSVAQGADQVTPLPLTRAVETATALSTGHRWPFSADAHPCLRPAQHSAAPHAQLVLPYADANDRDETPLRPTLTPTARHARRAPASAPIRDLFSPLPLDFFTRSAPHALTYPTDSSDAESSSQASALDRSSESADRDTPAGSCRDSSSATANFDLGSLFDSDTSFDTPPDFEWDDFASRSPSPPPAMAVAPFVSFSPKLPQFSGEPQEECAQFLARLERMLGLYPNVTAEQRLFYLENCCHGSAQTVVARRLKELDTQLGQTAATKYTAVRTALAEAFPTIVDKQNLRDQLQTRIKRPTESYSQFAQEILKLCQKLGIDDVADQLREIHKGVDLVVAAALRPGDYRTVDEFVRAAHSLEATHRAALRAHTQYSLQNSLPPPVFALPAGLQAVQAVPALPPLPAAPPQPQAVLPQPIVAAPAFVPPAAAVQQPPAPPQGTAAPAEQSKAAVADDALQQLIGKLEKLTVAAVQAASAPQAEAPRAPRGSFRGNRRNGGGNDHYQHNAGGNFNQEPVADFRAGNSYQQNSGTYQEGPGRNYGQQPQQQYQQSGYVQNGVYMRGGQGHPQQWQVSNLPQQRYQPRATNPSYRSRGMEREFAPPTYSGPGGPQGGPQPAPRPAAQRRPLACFYCAGQHMIRDCPVLPPPQSASKN